MHTKGVVSRKAVSIEDSFKRKKFQRRSKEKEFQKE